MSEEDRNLLMEMRANCCQFKGTTNSTYNDEKRFKKAKAIENVIIERDKYKIVLDKIKENIEKENEYLEKAKEIYVECENEDIKINAIQLINNSIVANYELNKILEEIE